MCDPVSRTNAPAVHPVRDQDPIGTPAPLAESARQRVAVHSSAAVNDLLSVTAALANAVEPPPYGTTDSPVERGCSVLASFGDPLMNAAGALMHLGEQLRCLEHGGKPWRARFAEAASPSLANAGLALSEAGQHALAGDRSFVLEALRDGAAKLDATAAAMLAVEGNGGAGLTFPLYAAVLRQHGTGLRRIAEVGANDHDLLHSLGELQRDASFQSAYLDAGWTGGFGLFTTTPAHFLLDDCEDCQAVGSTRYRTDVYVSRIGCTSSGVFNVCRWNVRSYTKEVCCCYEDSWDLFWATNCCDRAIATRGPIASVKRRTHAGSPPAAGFSVVTLC